MDDVTCPNCIRARLNGRGVAELIIRRPGVFRIREKGDAKDNLNMDQIALVSAPAKWNPIRPIKKGSL